MQEQTVEDKVFGTLTWNKSLNCWQGQREAMPGCIVSVTVLAEDTPLATVLNGARPAFQRLRTGETALRQAAADALLSLYNTSWNDDPPLDSGAFMARMTLTEFAAYEDGGVDISYDDGDLFFGHTITISLDEGGGVENVSING